MGSPATTCTSSIARCRDTIPLSGGGTSPLVSYVETQARRSPRAPREGTQNQTELARRCRTGNSPCPTATCEPSTPRPTGATVTQPIPTHQPKPQYNTLIAKPPTKHLTKFPLRWFTQVVALLIVQPLSWALQSDPRPTGGNGDPILGARRSRRHRRRRPA